jgi:LuxR family maltose regulon positive regulatory protein
MATAPVLAERLGDAYASPCPPPVLPDGVVARPRLVDRLVDPAGPPLALITAPAGYGRTTLLAEWALDDPRGVAWIALGAEHDDDPSLLAAEIARALERPGPFALVLDDVHLLRSKGARNVLRALVDSVPPGSRVALSSRTAPPLPVGRLRAQRSLIEIDARALAMTTAEARELLEAEGVRLSAGEVAGLVRSTEGWPAVLYLAALSLREGGDASSFAGDDCAVREYLADAVLSDLPDGAARFLARTSVVDRLSGGLCDAILGSAGSGRVLEDLAAGHGVLVRLDRSGEWYRCSRVLRQMLASELRRTDPASERELRQRATEWYAAHGDAAQAIDQAIAADALDRAAELLWDSGPRYVAAGRGATVARWIARLPEDRVGADPRLALVAAFDAFARGDLGVVQRCQASAARRLRGSGRPAPDGQLAGAAQLMHAAVARHGMDELARGAAAARDAMPEDSSWRSIACFLEGAALSLSGDSGRAERVLEEGARQGAVVAPGPHTWCLAQLALMAAERGDWEEGSSLAARARGQVEHNGLEDYPTSALVYAASAAVRARRGRVGEANDDLRHAMRLVDALPDFAPWYTAEVRVTLARAAVRLSDVAAARDLIAAARRDARRIAGAALIEDWISELEASADAASAAALPGPASLTAAELRILRYLPTHLSFREIASRLYVSANTVKTQAHAVYRKLDASSRSQAVARAAQLGLLDV